MNRLGCGLGGLRRDGVGIRVILGWRAGLNDRGIRIWNAVFVWKHDTMWSVGVIGFRMA